VGASERPDYSSGVTLLPLLVIQHEDQCPPEWFGGWLSEAGLRLDVRSCHLGEATPPDLSAHSGMLVLGGEMGANDDERYAWLTATKALIRVALESQRPTLGICLGHQLAAVALGGASVVNPRGSAAGLTPVRHTAQGRSDPLLGSVPDGALSVQWNDDIVDPLPVGAQTLAVAPDGSVQAARFGVAAWGVQFHPELSPALFRAWTVDKASPHLHRADGVDILGVAQAIDAAQDDLRRSWEPLARRFAQIVTAGANDRAPQADSR